MRVDEAFGCVRHAFETGRMPSAMIITGDIRGCAAELATQILQLIFCRGKAPPCGSCPACNRIRCQTAFDVVWIAPEKKSRQISIEQIRERLIHAVTQTSLEGGWKAGVLVGADRMNASAANAFLKTLEEPPPQTLFLLLTDSPQNLLPTILSRCLRVDLHADARAADAPWRGELLAILAEPLPPGPVSAMAVSARICALLAGMKQEAEERVKAEAQSETGLDETDEALSARISARYREMRQALLIALQDWYRDLLVLRTGEAGGLLRHPGSLEILRPRAERLTLAQALANIAAVEGIQRQLERNLSEETVFAYWLDRVVTGVESEKRA